MKTYLVFRLYGPMASWGQAAVGGDRPTGLQPTRSALLGLLGAALGIQRENAQKLNDLQNSVLIAVKQCAPSSLIRDFHTVQMPSQNKKVFHRTRKSELSEPKLNTVLSSRDYRCDGLWIIALRQTPHAVYALAELQQALLQPVYALALGRKSCPPALPLAPKLVECANLKTALDTPFPSLTRSAKEDGLWLNHNGLVNYYWEGDKTEIDHANTLTTEPWDDPISRTRWQFKQHTLHQLSLEEASHVPV